MLSPSSGRVSPEGADIADDSLSSSQKSLSSTIEARVFSEFMANDQVEVHRKAPRPQRQPWCPGFQKSTITLFQDSKIPGF